MMEPKQHTDTGLNLLKSRSKTVPMQTEKTSQQVLKAEVKNGPDKQKPGFSDSWASNPRSSNGSVFYDSDATNLSSSANSTLKSDLSSTKPTREEALATLDSFILDVNQVVEQAKAEEERARRIEKARQEEARPRASTVTSKKKASGPSAKIRRSSSLPSISSFAVLEFAERDTQPPHSVDDVRSPEYEVFSDSETVGAKSKAFPFKKKTDRYDDSSASSQTGDFPESYGIVHLNQLRKFLEGYKQLQMENTELTKRVTNLQESYLKRPPEKYDNLLGGMPPPPPRNSMIFVAPKEKPKKSKQSRLKVPNQKERAKSSFFSPLIFSAKSFDNLKMSSSHNFEKFREKQTRTKKSSKYSHDDIEVGKSMHDETEDWRNCSVKSQRKEPELSFTDFVADIAPAAADTVDSPPPPRVVEELVVPVVAPRAEATTPQPRRTPQKDKSPLVNKKVFPKKQTSPSKTNPDERNYVNTKKTTEWAALQETFPVTQIETNIDLLNHLETMVHSSKVARKTSHHKKHGPGRLVHKKRKSPATSMYLPSPPIQGFASTCLAAHAMANQLTLALNLSDLEALSTTEVDKPQSSVSGQPIPIP